MAIFKGSGTATVTPFNDSGVDYAAFEKLIEFQIENGTAALIVCGTTGEPSTMSREERQAVIEFAIKQVHGRIPVVASTGGNNTAEVVDASIKAEKAGADALLVVTPYYNKATQHGLVSHYNAVGDAVGIPIIVYNVPGRTGLNVLPETLAKMGEHKNIAAMKEASGNIMQIADMIRLCGDSVDMYSGEDGTTLPLMALGGYGVISVAGNIVPKHMHDLTSAILNDDYAVARKLQMQLNPLVDALFCEMNPIPAKAGLYAMGMIEDNLRLPLEPMSDTARERLHGEMKKFGLI